MHALLRSSFAVSIALSFALGAQAQEGSRDVTQFNLEDGLALKGYDPVSFFPEGGSKPQKGKTKYALEYEGITYRFASAKHAKLFEGGPKRFEPTYGGYCAFAVAKGKKVDFDPKHYSLIGGRLFLFVNEKVRDDFVGSAESMIADATTQWQKLSGMDETARVALKSEEAVDFHLGEKSSFVAQGYDPVTYFPEGGGKPRKGSKKWTVSFRGGDYAFSSKKTREVFLRNPSRYAPAYHGYCAFGLASGYLAPIDPKSFVIENGRLLLFYAGTDKRWGRDPKLAEKAAREWKKRVGGR